MSNYKLVKNFMVAGVTSLVLTATGCNKYNDINDSIYNKYVIEVDGEVKIVEDFGKSYYRDIINGNRYNKSNDVLLKGKLNEFYTIDEIMKIENSTYLNDEEWNKIYEDIRNKYQVMWNDTIINNRASSNVECVYKIKGFEDEYSSLIDSNDIYILDTTLADISDIDDMDKTNRKDYYLFVNNESPINDNKFDKLRLLFQRNELIKDFRFSNSFFMEKYFSMDLILGRKFSYIDNDTLERKQAIFKINDFYEEKGFIGKKDGYTILELEQLMSRLNKEEVEKIASDRVYVFDATVSDIDILSIYASGDISSLKIDNYYVLIQNEEISNTFSTLSNNHDSLLGGDIYIDSNSRLISSSMEFMFSSNIDLSYNFIPINDFLRSRGLDEYIEDAYSLGVLNKFDWSLNKSNNKNIKSRKLI